MKQKTDSSPFRIKSLSSLKATYSSDYSANSKSNFHAFDSSTSPYISNSGSTKHKARDSSLIIHQNEGLNFRPSSAPSVKQVDNVQKNTGNEEGIVFYTPIVRPRMRADELNSSSNIEINKQRPSSSGHSFRGSLNSISTSNNFSNSKDYSNLNDGNNNNYYYGNTSLNNSPLSNNTNSKARPSELLHRFRNAPPMSKKERMNHLEGGDMGESKNQIVISTLHSSSKKNSRPKSSGTSQFSPYKTYKIADIYKKQSSSPQKKPKRRSSDSSLLLNGQSLTSIAPQIDTTPKRNSVDYSRRASTDKSLSMSMIRNNLRNIPYDGEIQPEYDKIKSDVKKMFGDLDVSLSFGGNELSSPLKSSEKRPKSSSVSQNHARGRSPLFRRYSLTESNDLINSNNEMNVQDIGSPLVDKQLVRSNSPQIKSIESSPNSTLNRKQNSDIPNRRKSLQSIDENSPYSNGQDSSDSKIRSKSASGIRRSRRKLILNNENMQESSNHASIEDSKDLPFTTTSKPINTEDVNKINTIAESKNNFNSNQEDVPYRSRFNSNKKGQGSQELKSISLNQSNETNLNSFNDLQQTNLDIDDLSYIHTPLENPEPKYDSTLKESITNFQKQVSETMQFVFSNMKLKTFFKFTIEDAPVTKRPIVKMRNRSKVDYQKDPIVNALQKKVDNMREKISSH